MPLEDVDVEVLLSRTGYRGKRGVVHLPSEDNSKEPRCDTELRLEDASYQTIPRDRLPDNARLCRECDPYHELPRPETGTSLAAILDATDPDVIDGPNGGGTP